MAKENKKKKQGLLKRLGIKLFKGVVFLQNKKEAKERIKHLEQKKAEFEMYKEMIQQLVRPTALDPLQQTVPNVVWAGDSNDAVYFYDFLKEWNNNGYFDANGMLAVAPATAVGGIAGRDANGDNRTIIAIDEKIEEVKPKIKLKPIDVFDELERIPTPISLENLEEKITMFKMKQKFIKQNHYAQKEVIDFQLRLENRLKYNEFKDFFDKFDCTTTEKIQKLISKYDLVLNTTDLFIATFPDDAIKIMNDYEQKTIALCNKKPIFYVIAEAKDFKKKYERNDPILLVQSPFGIYWNILGAWDKEILLLEEL